MRRRSPRSLSWLAGLTASFILASLVSLVPAAAESCCTLVFTVQPADNLVADGIDGSAYDGDTPFVTVAAVNSAGVVNPSFRATIELVATTNSSGATLSGNRVRAVNGVAEFPDLAVNRSSRLVLQAQSSAVAPSGWPYSNPFKAVDDLCVTGDDCTASFVRNGTRLFDASFQNGAAEAAVLSAGADPPPDPWPGVDQQGCSTPDFVDPNLHAAGTSTTELASMGAGGTVTITIRITKAWRKLSEARGNPLYRICGAVPAAADANPNLPPYPSWNNSPVTLVNGEWVWLWPDCTATITKYCMVSVISNGGDIIETAITTTGIDPKHW